VLNAEEERTLTGQTGADAGAEDEFAVAGGVDGRGLDEGEGLVGGDVIPEPDESFECALCSHWLACCGERGAREEQQVGR
jgi:hypothetical protein